MPSKSTDNKETLSKRQLTSRKAQLSQITESEVGDEVGM